MSAHKPTKTDFVSIIPSSAPGIYSLGVIANEEGIFDSYSKTPIIGWAFDKDGISYPVTPEGIQFGNVYLLYSDGSVELPGFEWFGSAAEWLKDQRDKVSKENSGADHGR